MLDKIKLALRYKNNLFDDEINIYIASCTRELVLSGIDETFITDSDESIVACMIAYCKYQLNFQGQGEKWKTIYDSIKLSLCLDSNYR